MAFINNNNKFNKLDNDKSNLKILRHTLDKMIRYSLTEKGSMIVRDVEYKSLYHMLNNIDEDSSYDQTEVALKNKFLFLKELVRLRSEEIMHDEGSIIEYMREFFKTSMSIDDLKDNLIVIKDYSIDKRENNDLSKAELEYINEYVRDQNQYSEVRKKTELLNDFMEAINNPNTNPSEIINEYKNDLYELTREMKKVDAIRNDQKSNTFNLMDPTPSKKMMEKTFIMKRSESNYLTSGIKLLDVMLGGGFERGRLYIFFGVPKSFKSGFLLNMALSACSTEEYNVELLNDKKKVPTVIYFTMENSQEETMERIFSYYTGKHLKSSDITHTEFYSTLRKETIDKTGINFYMIYRNKSNEKGSITTDYLYELYDKLVDDGMEPILLVHDYLARINSRNYESEIRLRLGAVTDEFVAFSKEKDIPVVTAAQLNRSAQGIFDTYQDERKTDALRNVNRTHISESTQIIENTDVAIAVHKQEFTWDPNTDEQYMMFKYIVGRNSTPKDMKNYFVQPFENGFKIATDYGTDRILGKDAAGSGLDNNQHQPVMQPIMNKLSQTNRNLTSRNLYKSISSSDTNPNYMNDDLNGL